MVAELIVAKDDQYVLNHCTRFLARDPVGISHDFGQYAPGDPRASICEAWHFPVVDSYFDGVDQNESYRSNTVTFVYDGRTSPPASVGVIGTFATLYQPIPLRPVPFAGEPTGYFSVSVRVPKGQVHSYLFLVDGTPVQDPINPQQTRRDNGQIWSRFFTDACQIPLVLDRRDQELLSRLVRHLLPFRTGEDEIFVQKFYATLDTNAQQQQFPLAWQLDEEVGAVNYIDKVLARSEQHNADDYLICLDIIYRCLQKQYGADPLTLPEAAYLDLLERLKDGTVQGWPTERYQNPNFFLLLMRRHAITGAFAHPRSGGNSGTAGWTYLEGRYPFDWERAIEAPLGANTDYRG